MQGSGRTGDNRALEIAEISRSLKILARELNIPIVALSQLNRSVENRPDKTPMLSDLRESGSIEQDADLVMFLGRDINEELSEDRSNEYGDNFSKVDVIIAKHRNGPVGKIKLKFDGSRQKFYDLTE
jgi:replicative DNA helicase